MAAGFAACGLGPLLVTQVVGAGGLRATPWCLVPGIILLTAAALLLRGHQRSAPAESMADDASQTVAQTEIDKRSIALLFCNAVLRAFAHIGLTVIVSYLVEKEWKLTVADTGYAIILLQAGAGLGNLAGGALTRTGLERRTLIGCVPICLAVLVPMALTERYVWFAWLFFYGLAICAPGPVLVALAQRIVPQRSALVSGIMVGPAWALGALLASATTPWLVEHAGHGATMGFLAIPLVLSAVVAWLLPAGGPAEVHPPYEPRP